MTLKFKKHKETIYTFSGKELRIERLSKGITRHIFARRMAKIMEESGDTWYSVKVERLESMFLNHVNRKTMRAIQKALKA